MQKKLTTRGEIEVLQEVLLVLKEVNREALELIEKKSTDYNSGFLDGQVIFTKKILERFGQLDDDAESGLNGILESNDKK